MEVFQSCRHIGSPLKQPNPFKMALPLPYLLRKTLQYLLQKQVPIPQPRLLPNLCRTAQAPQPNPTVQVRLPEPTVHRMNVRRRTLCLRKRRLQLLQNPRRRETL